MGEDEKKAKVIAALRHSHFVWDAYNDCDLTDEEYETLANDILDFM